MPKQINGVQLTDNGDGTCNIQIGLSGYTRQIADLFNFTDLDTEHVRQNCRLAFLIGGYAQPDSLEFLNGVNKGQAGLEARFGNVVIQSVQLSDPDAQAYEITFAIKSGTFRGQTFGVPMSLSDFQADSQDDAVILSNLSSFLRKGNFTSLTTGAITAARAQNFWK